MIVTIYVPAPGSAFEDRVQPSAAIVGTADHEGDVAAVIYDEQRGGYSAGYRERLRNLIQHWRAAPESARSANVPLKEVVVAGAYDADRHIFLGLQKADLLSDWADERVGALSGHYLAPGRYPQDQLPRAVVDSLQFEQAQGPRIRFRTMAGQIVECDTRSDIVAIR